MPFKLRSSVLIIRPHQSPLRRHRSRRHRRGCRTRRPLLPRLRPHRLRRRLHPLRLRIRRPLLPLLHLRIRLPLLPPLRALHPPLRLLRPRCRLPLPPLPVGSRGERVGIDREGIGEFAEKQTGQDQAQRRREDRLFVRHQRRRAGMLRVIHHDFLFRTIDSMG
jgi:hypothetical protein